MNTNQLKYIYKGIIDTWARSIIWLSKEYNINTDKILKDINKKIEILKKE